MKTEAFILVGGRSSRLGRDKAFERIGGRTLAERSLGTVESSGIASKIVFVTGNDVEIAIEATRLDADFVFDVIAGRGPLGGLYTGLMNTTAEWIFLLACDLPFVTADLIVSLYHYTDRANGFGAVVPEQPDGRLQPLSAFYKVAAAKPVVDEIIRRQRPSPPMHEIAALLQPRIVKPSEYAPPPALPKNYFTNINSDYDLADAREIERKLSPPDEI